MYTFIYRKLSQPQMLCVWKNIYWERLYQDTYSITWSGKQKCDALVKFKTNKLVADGVHVVYHSLSSQMKSTRSAAISITFGAKKFAIAALAVYLP